MKRKSFSLAKRGIVISLLVVLLAFSFVGETGAYLHAASGTDITRLTAPTSEKLTFSGTSATALTLTNSSNIPVYVRVCFTANYMRTVSNLPYYLAYPPQQGSSKIYAEDHTTFTNDYTYTLNSNWIEKNITETVGGKTATYKMFYLKAPLGVGATSSAIFSNFTVNNTTRTYGGNTYRFELCLLADSIQCENSGRFIGGATDTAVYKAWGVTPASVGGNLSSYPSGDGAVYHN